MKKVCFIVWDRFSYGGISRVISNVIYGLCDEYEITILCLKKQQFLENVYNIDFKKVKIVHCELTRMQKVRRELVDRYCSKVVRWLSLPLTYYFHWRYSGSFRKKLISVIGDHFDVVIGASGLTESYLLSTIAPRIGGRKIGWMHTSFEGYFLQGTPREVDFNLKMAKHHLSGLEQLLVLSYKDAKKYNIFCPCTVLYNPVSFSCETVADPDSKRFIFIGALSKIKGGDILIDAFVIFAKKHVDWTLDIYGDGPLWSYILKKIRENNVANRVILNHSIKNVKQAYLHAGALLFPSRLEGFGIVQGEAMTCGLPVLAHRLPITEELVEDYGCGLLYTEDTPEAFSAIMEQYAGFPLDKKKELQANALRRSKSFGMEDILDIWKQKVV